MLQLCRPFASIPLSFCLFAPPAIAAHVVTPLRAQEPWKAQNVTGFTSNFKTFPTFFWGWFENAEDPPGAKDKQRRSRLVHIQQLLGKKASGGERSN